MSLVGILFIYNQGNIINKIVEKDIARRVDFRNLSDGDLATVIRDVLDNKQYI